MAQKRRCIVDLTEYKYCPHCGDDPAETWRFIYCSENCRGIDRILQNYKSGKINALEAQEQLKDFEVNVEKIHEVSRRTLVEIYAIKPEIKEEVIEEIPEVKEEVVLINEETVAKVRSKRKKASVIEEKIDE